MKPRIRTQRIEDLANALSPQKTTRKESITVNKCSWCGGPADEFKDKLSQKEYTISGFCQKCQDEVFG